MNKDRSKKIKDIVQKSIDERTKILGKRHYGHFVNEDEDKKKKDKKGKKPHHGVPPPPPSTNSPFENALASSYGGSEDGGGVAPAEPKILDDRTGSNGAWSMCRQLSNDYHGPLFECTRRTAAGVIDGTQDIDFVVGTGEMNEDQLITFVTEPGFGGSATHVGMVTKIYDQSGNANDMNHSGWNSSQANTLWPKILEGGTIYTTNGKPDCRMIGTAAKFDTPNDPSTTDDTWQFSVQQWTNPPGVGYPIFTYNAHKFTAQLANDNYYLRFIASADPNAVNAGTPVIYLNGAAAGSTGNDMIAAFATDTQSLVTIANIDFTAVGGVPSRNWTAGLNLFGWHTASFAPQPFRFQEQIMWPDLDHDQDKAFIEDNINDYYSIY